MKTISIESFRELKKKVNDLEDELWKVQNPPRFDLGDEVEWKSGQTNEEFIRAKVVDIVYIDEYWQYTLWVYDWNKLHEYDGESSFYDKDHVQIRKINA